MKSIALVVIFVYAFSTFPGRTGCSITSRSCRATPRRAEETPEAEAHVLRTARLFRGRAPFNHGQRAFFFALDISAGSSSRGADPDDAAVVFVMPWRQFGSDARRAMDA